jgi:adenosylcobinamide-GDP ribazoletransferase
MMRELEAFLAAVGYFTRLPVPSWVGQSEQQREQQLEQAARYLPLVGVIVGGVGAVVSVGVAQGLPMPLAILAGMAATLLVTGAFHEDGFADTVDGFGGSPDRNRVLEIMKDPRIGSFGAIGITLMLLAKFNALQQIGAWHGLRMLGFALIAGHALSRFAPITLMFALHYVREDENSKSRPLVGGLSVAGLSLAAVLGLAPCLLLWSSKIWLALVLTTVVTVIVATYFVRRIGGYTGDCLGATQQLAELAFYVGLAWKPS